MRPRSFAPLCKEDFQSIEKTNSKCLKPEDINQSENTPIHKNDT